MSPVDCCHVPAPASRTDSQIYESIRSHIVKSHCAARRGPHLCCGCVTIDRTSITLQCPLCGDAKSLIEPKDQSHG